jgi:hypothetical protein
VIDSFFAYVEARVDALFDNEEPVDVDAVTVTTPDTTESEPLQ